MEASRVRTFNDREEYYGGEDWARILVEALPEDIDLVLSCWLYCKVCVACVSSMYVTSK